MKRQTNRIIHLVPMIVIMGIIFFLSHQPGDRLYIPLIPGFDKIAHMVVYAALAAAVLYAFNLPAKNKMAVHISLLTIGICVLYGIVDEFHQSFIPSRSVSFADLVADAMGAIAACVIWFSWRGRRNVEAEKQYYS